MKCVICRHGEIRPGVTDVLLSPGTLTLVVKGVPALICGTCGEEYVDEQVTKVLLKMANSAESAGVRVELRQYATA